MNAYEKLTLAAVFGGPIVAVAITLWIDARRKAREQKLVILKMLLATRHLVGDPMYSQAINLIPVEFAGRPRVLAAHKEYIDAVRVQPNPDNTEAILRRSLAKQSHLVFEIARSMGFNIAESDIQIEGYAADAWIRRDNLTLDSQQAMRDIATILALQTKLLGSGNLNADEVAFIDEKAPKE